MGIDFSKTDRDPENPQEVQGLLVNAMGVKVDKLQIQLKWTQPESANRTGGRLGGWLSKGKDAADKTDVDGNVVVFLDEEDVEFAGPDNLSALGGLIRHRGNVAKGSADTPEIIDIDLAGISSRESDITALAITASCFLGDFSKVTGCRVDFFDQTSGSLEPLGTIRFAITNGNGNQPNNAALTSVIVKTDAGWVWRKAKQYGRARDWRALAGVCRRHVTQ